MFGRVLLAACSLAAFSLAACSGGSGGGGGDPGGGGTGGGLFTDPGSGGGSTSKGGAVVAVVELEAPERGPFVLRATLPVPAGTFPRADGKVPLALRGPDGFVVPTQLEAVSWYADASDGADVVEVLGRVELPVGTVSGQRVAYEVVEHVSPSGPLPLDGGLVDFLTQPGNALLVAEDVFGHRYEVDLLAGFAEPELHPRVAILRQGRAAVQLRSYGVMRPTGEVLGPPDGALPHLLGVHAYVTAWAGTGALALDLRVHNGFDGADPADPADDPLGKVYFRSLELWLPKGWTAAQDVTDVAAGEAYLQGGWSKLPLIAAREDGKLHVMPHQAQLQRRLAIAPAAHGAELRQVADDAGLAFCRRGQAPGGGELWSWWNPQTARYFPQRHLLPDLSFLDLQALEAELDGTYWMAREALESGNPGNYAVPSPALGWAHPWGIEYGGMTGAVEIHLYDGVQLAEVGSREGWLGVRLAHRMNTDRQPIALYDAMGEPTHVEKWVEPGSFPHIDMNFWMTLLPGQDPFGFGDAPQFQVQHVAAAGLAPGYEGKLASYLPHDFQHFVRYTRSPKVLAWLGNDALARDDLRHAAEIVRMSMHDYPDGYGKWHAGAALFGFQEHVEDFPSNGMAWGRGEAWSLDTVVAAYATGGEAWRERARPWLELCADLVAQGQVSCSGFVMASHVPQWLTGEYRMRSQPEHTIIEHTLWGLRETVFRGTDAGRDAQTRAVIAAATATVIGPIAWSDDLGAPWFLAATAPLDPALPAFCESAPPEGLGSGGDGFFSWASFGYGWELGGDAEFLDKAATLGGGPDALTALLARLANGNTNLETVAALLATLQQL